jgi:HPt (histidine-containing phosphotransfer) domain-containing protein
MLDKLRRLGGEALVRDVIVIFLDTVPARMAAARAAVERGDVASLKLAAHTMRGSCGQLGAVRMRELCERVERAASTLDLAASAHLLDAMERELGMVRDWLGDARTGVRGAA